MIELERDQLCFSFPTVTGELRGLTHRYVDSLLKKIFAENRREALKRYLDNNWHWGDLPEGDRLCALKEVEALSEPQIRRAIDDQVCEHGQVDASCQVEFQRTLRLPDDGKKHYLPPGLGRFPLRHVDDYAENVPPAWIERGGVMMPMYQAEALWLYFHGDYPFAIKIGSGKVNALTGGMLREGLEHSPQNYLVLPDQPWLDGFAVKQGTVRQFVAVPLGEGCSVEEQITEKSETGGIQIQACPMIADVFFEREIKPKLPGSLADLLPHLISIGRKLKEMSFAEPWCCEYPSSDMGLAMGGKMRQEVYRDRYGIKCWNPDATSRCFIHLCNALVWREITGSHPPQTPVTAREYEEAGLPWFDYYRDDFAVLEGSKTLAGLKSLAEMGKMKTGRDGAGDSAVTVPHVIHCGPKRRPGQVREWVE